MFKQFAIGYTGTMSQESPATVLWLTGLSAAGKTTIARRLWSEVRRQGHGCVHLDGDLFREVMGDGLGHDHAARLENAYRLARMCRLLSLQGVPVICSTMSLFPEIWEWNRKHLPNYFEVYLKAGVETLRRRDPKGIYQRAESGGEANVVGLDLPFVEPTSSNLIVENQIDGEQHIAAIVRQILAASPLGIHA